MEYSEITAQTVQNENLRYRYIKVFQRTISCQIVFSDKNVN